MELNATSAIGRMAAAKVYPAHDEPAVLSKREERIQELTDKYLKCPVDIVKISSRQLPIGVRIDIYA